MIVISDTTPLNYLILIGEAEVLTRLYGRLIVPQAVHDELSRPAAPAEVRAWLIRPPAWLEVRSVDRVPDLPGNLGLGEREAIALAETLHADQLIVDDMAARREAQRRGISVIGTLGVLREAAEEGYLDLRITIEKLAQTSFHISPALIDYLLRNSQ